MRTGLAAAAASAIGVSVFATAVATANASTTDQGGIDAAAELEDNEDSAIVKLIESTAENNPEKLDDALGEGSSSFEDVYNYCSRRDLNAANCARAQQFYCQTPGTTLIVFVHEDDGEHTRRCVTPDQKVEIEGQDLGDEAQQAFTELPIQLGSVKFEPDLLGFGYEERHTNMFIEAPTEHVSRSLLGQEVEIRAQPMQFRWDYGDGTSRTTHDAGAPLPDYDGTGSPINKTDFATPTSQVYEETGIYPVTVEVIYYGEYRVGDEAWEDIPGTISVESSPGEADIWTQNSRWVSGACESRDQWGCNGPIQFDPATDRPPKIYQDQYDENGRWIGPVD